MQADKTLLNIKQIQNDIPFGRINYFETISSTSSWLKENGKCGDICISDMQTEGRGRRGNQWLSPKTGNIYLSICTCFDEITKYWTLLGLVVGITIAEVLADIGLKGHGVKWPNDIFWKYRKLGGILIETVAQSGKVIIGIGLNMTMPPEYNERINQEIVSLDEIMADQVCSREILITKLIVKLQHRLKDFNSMTFNQFLSDWETWDILRDEVVGFAHQGADVIGKVVEVDHHGRLGVQAETGQIEYYSSAEIKIRRHEHGNIIG